MRKNTCEVIRRELDELNLDETCSTAAIAHLRECGACRDFHEKQTKLRQIVGGLGTVSAPADFDFRLRARLANESSAVSSFHFIAWPVIRRGLATAAVLLVFATGAFLVRNVLNRPPAVDQTAKQAPVPAVHDTPRPTEIVIPSTSQAPKLQEVAVVQKKQPHRVQRSEFVAFGNKPLATRESSSTGATVIGNTEPLGTSEAFPIDASSLQSFKVLVDDGRGNAKTISVPTISFGSQRLMQNANHYAPKRVW